MATVTIVATSNADGTMTIAGSGTGGLNVIVTDPKDESKSARWPRHIANFIRGTLYP